MKYRQDRKIQLSKFIFDFKFNLNEEAKNLLCLKPLPW